MCDISQENKNPGARKLPAKEAVGTVLAHDITEIRPGEFKGRAFKKGHIIREEDICHLQRLGKENLFVLSISEDEMHEDDAAHTLAQALMGKGVRIKGEPKEGKINIIAEVDGLLQVNTDALLAFNMLGDVMCATVHTNTVVKKGQTVAATRAIPLIVKKDVVQEAVRIAVGAQCIAPVVDVSGLDVPGGATLAAPSVGQGGIISVREIRRPKAGVVITGNEVYYGRIKDAFGPVISKKIEAMDGEIVGTYYAPDDEAFIEARLRELINAGADLLITTGGMSVDPDDVTRFAIRSLGATEMTYGSAVLPGAMFLVGYIAKEQSAISNQLTAQNPESSAVSQQASALSPDNSKFKIQNSKLIPILGIPACGMYAATTVFDLILPRVLAGETIGRRELAQLGHGGLCMKCEVCRYPVCPFGK
ncbi:MAG: molybdopterin-binding protein [Thermodesulfovibrionales bacterium]